MYVIGTAGHVDHGKSLLVEALTGIDPDRLREEKARGMTIDLGFAWLRLADGRSVSIVDVPGHERFIKNMLAGAGGIDLALLVVAADDGVMPQTREHLAILDLLDVRRGVVAITKRDLVDADWLSLVSADVEELLTGSTLEGSPIVSCSSVTRAGLDELLAAIGTAINDLPPKRDIGRPRLPIDRVFTIGGFGTVVTGTLIDGEFGVGEEIEATPGGLRGRIRGLQTHGESVERAVPRTRTAVNVTGIAKEELRRGMVLARPGALRSTSSIDVRLRAVGGMRRPIRHNLAVTFHSGADEANAQVRLLREDELRAGDSTWAQIKLDSPVAVMAGDRFVLRTPNDTVAGGVIAAIDAKRHRRRDPKLVGVLEAMLSQSPEERVLGLAVRLPPLSEAAIALELGLPQKTVATVVSALLDGGDLVRLRGEGIVAATQLAVIGAHAQELLRGYHARYPLRDGIPAEEFRSRLALDAATYAALAPLLPGARLNGATVALAEFHPAPTDAQRRAIDAYLSALRAHGASPPSAPAIDAELIAYLADTGAVVDVGDGIIYEAADFAAMTQQVRRHIEESGTITLAQARDLLGTSRKYAQAVLEHLDRTRVTRRIGDERVLR